MNIGNKKKIICSESLMNIENKINKKNICYENI